VSLRIKLLVLLVSIGTAIGPRLVQLLSSDVGFVFFYGRRMLAYDNEVLAFLDSVDGQTHEVRVV
jgi:hypothetical protein